MNEDGIKKIQFESTFKKHGDLKIQLHYDDLNAKEFFNAVVDAYISGNENILELVGEIKERKQISMMKRKRANKSAQKAKGLKKQFALEQKEIDNIFDILERENKEL